nr:hypothetical protein [Pseudomonas sp.]
MIIKLSPVDCAWDLPEVIYSKDALTINGELFDFGPLPNGAVLPLSAIDSIWFAGDVKREGGEITLTLILPYSVFPLSRAVAFPEPIRVTKAGAVKLPFDVPEPAEEVAHVD